jgi:nucleoside-diphosphate-sugar epimerase
VLNVTGRESLRVRDLAKALASRLGREAKLRGTEAPTALLSDASACARLFGPPTVSLDTLLDWTADWVRRGGRSLGRPTHYERRDGRF